LIVSAFTEITGQRLPSQKQTLQLFFHFHKDHTVHDSAALDADQILQFWNRDHIRTKKHYHVIAHVEKLVTTYNKLKKYKCRKTDTQRKNEDLVVADIEELFDMANEDATALIKIEEDKEFLKMQRSGRKGYIGTVDKELADKEKRIAMRKKAAEKRMMNERDRCEEAAETVTEKEASTSSDDTDDDKSPDFLPITKSQKVETPVSADSQKEKRCNSKRLFYLGSTEDSQSFCITCTVDSCSRAGS